MPIRVKLAGRSGPVHAMTKVADRRIAFIHESKITLEPHRQPGALEGTGGDRGHGAGSNRGGMAFPHPQPGPDRVVQRGHQLDPAAIGHHAEGVSMKDVVRIQVE
jgi:hypothetical protein